MTTLDAIPISQLQTNWIEFLKTVDERIGAGFEAENTYHKQINLILDNIGAMATTGTGWLKLNREQQDLITLILMKEIASEN